MYLREGGTPQVASSQDAPPQVASQDAEEKKEGSKVSIVFPTHEEIQYLDLIRRILDQGYVEPSRNGNTLSVFGNAMRFSLKDGALPLVTTKKLAWKACFTELIWFLRGQTDNRILNQRGVHIWDANSSRAFLDSRNLPHYSVGDIGPGYGYQWRRWNAPYHGCDIHVHETNAGIDQLAELIRNLKNPATRNSRRHIISTWNPEQLDEMALPPCHVLMQFNVRDNMYLSCSMYQRSGDVGLGVPFNIASYSLLTHIIAKHCGLFADEFVYFLGNAHVYEEHAEILRTQLDRTPFPFPRIAIQTQREHIEDYDLDDIHWITLYDHHGVLKMPMIA